MRGIVVYDITCYKNTVFNALVGSIIHTVLRDFVIVFRTFHLRISNVCILDLKS